MAKRVQKPPSSSRQRASAQAPASQATVERIARALERLAPSTPETPRFAAADAFSWHPDERRLAPVANVNRVEMSLLKGIDRLRDMLLENTQRFVRGLPANNALLWGDRKSTRLNSSHSQISYAVFCLKKKNDSLHEFLSAFLPRTGEEALSNLLNAPRADKLFV